MDADIEYLNLRLGSRGDTISVRKKKSVAPMGLFKNICHVILPTLNADGIKYRVLSSVKSARPACR